MAFFFSVLVPMQVFLRALGHIGGVWQCTQDMARTSSASCSDCMASDRQLSLFVHCGLQLQPTQRCQCTHSQLEHSMPFTNIQLFGPSTTVVHTRR